MQEYRNDKLVVRYDPAICIHAGCVRSPFRLQCLEKAVDRREQRVPGRDHRTGQRVPVRRMTYEVLKDAP